MSIEWKRRCTVIGIVAGVYVGYRYILPVAVPFLMAWILASWIYPVAFKIERKIKVKRSLAGAIILFLILGSVGILVLGALAELFAQIKNAAADLPALQKMSVDLLDTCCLFVEKNLGITAEKSKNYILANIGNMKESVMSFVTPQNVTRILGSIKNVIVLISGIVVTFISTLLLMSDMDDIRKKFREYSWLMGTRRVIERLKKTTILYLKAQMIIVLLISAVCAAGFWWIGNAYFLLFGIALGLLDAIPVIGTGTILYPAAVILLIKGNTFAAVVCILLDIVTSFLRELLEPKLLGGKLGISPIVILVSVYFGVFIFGVWGVLLGPLSFSTVYEIGCEMDIWD